MIDPDEHPVLTIALLAVAIVTFLVVSAFTFAATGARLKYAQEIADFETLRLEAARVAPNEAEDVAGQVAAENRALAVRKVCNRQWWCDWTEVDGWNRVAPIEMPRR